MPKLPFPAFAAKAPAQIGGAWRFWNLFKTFSVADIAEEAERPFALALIGTDDQTHLLQARLALETPVPHDLGPDGPADVGPFVTRCARRADAPPESIALDADALTAGEAALTARLVEIITAHPELRVSLARRVPAFRPAAAASLIADASKDNAKIALLSALPGVVPFTDWLMPATALGDTIVLTRNQARLLVRIAAAYGKEVNLKARTRELLPVVGSAFGWRTVARELIGLVPGGIGLLIKGAIAYAGTYTVGKTATIYYSTGQTLTGPRVKALYQDAYKEALSRVRSLLPGRRGTKAAKPTS